MFKFLLKTLLLLATLAAAAHADAVNGVWITNTNDTLILLETQKGVVGLDFNTQNSSQKLRYALQGAYANGQLSMQSPSGNAVLTATLADSVLLGSLTLTDASGAHTSDFKATLAMAYAGSGEDGLWQIDGKTAYLAYATFAIGSVKTVMVPYLAFENNQLVDYDLYSGSIVTNPRTGVVSYVGASLLDKRSGSAAGGLGLVFPSANAATASGAFTQDGGTTAKFTATKLDPATQP